MRRREFISLLGGLATIPLVAAGGAKSSAAVPAPGVSGGLNNLTTWPDEPGFRPTYTAADKTLRWVGPIGGGPSTANDVAQAQVLIQRSGGWTIDNNVVAMLPTEMIDGVLHRVLQNYYIPGAVYVDIGSTNICVRRNRIDRPGSLWYCLQFAKAGHVIVEDNEISNGGFATGANPAIGGNATIVRRNHLHNCSPGCSVPNNGLIVDNYIHNLANAAGSRQAHYDGITSFGGGNGTRIEHNTISNQNGQTDCIILQSGGAIDNITITNNRLLGSAPFGYCLQIEQKGGPGPSNIHVTNNRLAGPGNYHGRGGGVGIVEWSGNVHDADGSPYPRY